MNKLFLHATYDCNARCVHCAVPRRREYLPFSTFKTMMDTFPIGALIIGGGEPLLHKDIDEMIDYAYPKSKVKIETNGGLLTEEFLRSNMGKIFQLNVSLDGIKETHDLIRGVPLFDHTFRMVTLARSLNIDVAVWSVLMASNFSEVDDIISIAREMGVDKLSFLYATPVGKCKPETLVNPSDYLGVMRKVKSQEDQSLQIRIAPYILPFGSRVDGIECLIPEGSILHVDPKGDIYPCVLLLDNEKYKLGNVELGYHKIRVNDVFTCLGIVESLGKDYRSAYGVPVCPCRTISSDWKT